MPDRTEELQTMGERTTTVTVERLRAPVSPSDFAQIASIYAQYSPAHLTRESVSAAAELHYIFVARDGDEFLGFVTLVVYRRMKALVAQIEDIVVSEKHRKRGVGAALWQQCCDQAATHGCLQVGLMTYPELEAANRFYRDLGLEEHTVRSYRKLL